MQPALPHADGDAKMYAVGQEIKTMSYQLFIVWLTWCQQWHTVLALKDTSAL